MGLAVADGRMTITIADNGRGFDAGSGRPGGNGLENMRQEVGAHRRASGAGKPTGPGDPHPDGGQGRMRRFRNTHIRVNCQLPAETASIRVAWSEYGH